MKRIVAGTYKIFNVINKKIYNGSSIDIEARLKRHKKNLKIKRASPHLQHFFDMA